MATHAAEILRAMADRCDRNEEAEFAGCVVLIPPPYQGQEGDAVELLLIDPAQDLANFWSTAKSKAAIAADEFAAQQSIPPMGGYR